MKSKIFRILGVVTTVAIVASMLIAPVSAVSGVSASVAATDTVIGTANADYTIYANVANQLVGASSRAITLPDIGDQVVITAGAATDRVKLTGFTGATITLAAGVTSATTGYAFSAIGQTITVQATALATTGTVTVTIGAPTIAAGADVTVAPACTAAPGAFALPDGGTAPVDTIVFTDTSAGPTGFGAPGVFTLPAIGDSIVFTSTGATDSVTITLPVAALTYTLGTGVTQVGGVITFTAIGQTATVSTATAANGGTWAQTVGAATAAVGVDNTDDVVTLTFTTGAATVAFAPAGGTYAAGVITFSVTGQTATVTGTVNNTAGTWARTTGAATGAAGANGNKLVAIAAPAVASDTITLTFPAGYVISAPTAVISASTGWVTFPGSLVAASVPAVTAGVAWTFDAPTRTIIATLGVGDYIGETSQIRFVITGGIQNPSVAGDYAITVKTSKETTAIAANVVTIVNPTPVALPGTVTVYNASNVATFNNNGATAITLALANVLGTGWTITIGEGTYSEGGLVVTPAMQGLTIKGAGAMANTFVGGDWTINGSNVTFTGLTLLPGPANTGIVVGLTGGGFKLDSCTLTRNGTATSVTAETLVTYNATTTTVGLVTTAATATISNNTFNTQLGIARDVGVLVGTGSVGLTITKNAFATDYSEPPNGIPWWDDAAIQANATSTISANTFTGPGWGVQAEAGTVTITGNTFTGSHQALQVGAAWLAAGAANVIFDSNTLTGCGATVTAWPTIGTYAIGVNFNIGSTVKIINNTITGAGTYVLNAAATANIPGITMMFNSIDTTNKAGVQNLAAATLLNATHNWWGAATGPAAAYNTALLVDASAPLGVVAAAGAKVFIAPAAAVTDATIGVTVTNTTATYIAFSTYAATPTIAVPAAATAQRFMDVVVIGGAATSTIRIAGTTAAPITLASGVYIWDAAFGRWTAVTGITYNTFANYLEFNCATNLLGGTPFALVAVKPVAPAAVVAMAGANVPLMGAINFPIDGTFSWNANAAGDAVTSYEIAVAEDSTLADKFAVINYSASTPINAHRIPADQVLKYNTLYWWRVRAVNAVGAGPWVTGFFTTEKAPAAVVTTAPTTATVTVPVVTSVPAPEITVQIPAAPSPVQPIPSYLLWAVIAVGAVLVIAVIVLIVRTRRIS